MKVIEADSKFKNIWDEIAGRVNTGSFLQSFAWGEFKKAMGKKVWRLIVSDTKVNLTDPFTSSFKILALAQVIKEDIPFFGSFLYIPHGPIFNTKDKEKAFNILQEKIKYLAKTEHCFMVRFEPKVDLDFAGLKRFSSALQARYNLKINLKPSLEEILTSFKSKTRYNIRLAEKKGVKVETGNLEDFSIFLNLLKKTAKRANFDIHPDFYNLKLYQILAKNNMAELLLAFAKKSVLATFVIIYFKDEATYFYGASSDQMRNLMPTYALMWEAIKRAKKRKCLIFDMRGVAKDQNNIKDPWYGLTRFKHGFAPTEKITTYSGTYILPVSYLKFYLYFWQRKLRRKDF